MRNVQIRINWIPQFNALCNVMNWRIFFCESTSISLKTRRVESTRANRQRSTEYLPSCANRHPVWRVVICCDELFDSSRIVSNRQHFLHCMVQKILTIDFRSFYALRTWEVYVFFCKSTFGMTDRHLLWRVVRFESNRVESSTFATLYSL